MRIYRFLNVLISTCIAVLLTTSQISCQEAPAKPGPALPALSLLDVRVNYSGKELALRSVLVDLAVASRVPICFENKTDRVENPGKQSEPLITVTEATTLGDALGSVMKQAPEYSIFWNRPLGYIHVVRKDILADPEWPMNRTIDKVTTVASLRSLMELIRTEKLGLKGQDAYKFTMMTASAGGGSGCSWISAADRQQIALNVEKIKLRDLLDEIGRQLGQAGWIYGTTRNTADAPIYGFISFYPAVDPMKLPPEYNAYYHIMPGAQ